MSAFAIIMLIIFGWAAVLWASYKDDRPAAPPRPENQESEGLFDIPHPRRL